jgi:type I restriction-modification system DNA methylase subunit
MNVPDKNVITDILAKKKLSKEDQKILESYEPNDGQNRLYSFFTPLWLCEVMLELAVKNGFDTKKGKVLEPAAGTGNFLTVLERPENCTAFELDPINFQIAQKRSPKTKIFNQYFETAFLKEPRYSIVLKNTTWLKQFPFDLVIGNPPYGKNSNLYSSYFRNPKFKQVEAFFMYKSMQLLKSGGLLVFITGSGFMRGDYLKEKTAIATIATFVDAYRMPKVFSGTSVPTDILIFRKK